jgi:hypothetical protein
MPRGRLVLVLSFASFTGAAIAACTLNPQPLPPDGEFASENSDASTRGDTGPFSPPPASNSDAGAGGQGDADAVPKDGGDAASDAGDAAPDADGG